MERKEFLKRGVLASALAYLNTAFSAPARAAAKLSASRYRGVEGVLSPTNTHMVGNGFKVMNFFPNGKGFEERMSPFFLLDFNAEVSYPPSEISRGVGVHPHRVLRPLHLPIKVR